MTEKEESQLIDRNLQLQAENLRLRQLIERMEAVLDPESKPAAKKCLWCEEGLQVERRSKDGRGSFKGCSRYPACKWADYKDGLFPDGDDFMLEMGPWGFLN